MVVAAHDAVDHDHDTGIVGLFDELAQCLFPCSHAATGSKVEPQRLPHAPRDGRNIVVQGDGPDEWSGSFSDGARIVPIPFLPLLADVDGFQKIRAWVADVLVAYRSEVRDGNLLDRSGRKKKVAHRGMHRAGEMLQLFQSWLGLAAFPRGQLRDTLRHFGRVESGAFTRPAQQLRFDLYTQHIRPEISLPNRHNIPEPVSSWPARLPCVANWLDWEDGVRRYTRVVDHAIQRGENPLFAFNPSVG